MQTEQRGGDEVLLSTSEVNRRYGFGQTKLYALLKVGEIDGILIGGKRLIVKASLDDMIARAPRFTAATPNGEGA